MRPGLADELDLEPHPEGGWFRETWRAAESVSAGGRLRSAATLIYFLLPAGEASAWHRVRSDETWLAHSGVVHLELGGGGDAPVPQRTVDLGVDVEAGNQPQVLVEGGVWQRTLPTDHDALVSCLVSPGFDFEDFELVTRSEP